MRQPVGLGSAALLACAVVALVSGPAYAGVLPSVTVTPTLPVPTLPVPEPSVPVVPVPSVSISVVPLPTRSPVEVRSTKSSSPRSPVGAKGRAAASPPRGQAPAVTDSRESIPDSRSALGLAERGMGHGVQRAPDPVDDYLLASVHDDLCAALSSILKPMPERVSGLSSEVIRQLPREIVNVVPEDVLARASVRCSTAAGSDSANTGRLTRVLGVLVHSGLMAGVALPLGLGLLALGVMLRRNGSRTAV